MRVAPLARTAVLVATYATVAGGLVAILVGYHRLSHTSLMEDAVSVHSSARMMMVSGLVVLAAAMVLHFMQLSDSRGSGRPPGSEASRRRTLGAIEGALSLVCFFYVINCKVDPGTRFHVPWAMLIAWGLGVGLGVGALRFGGSVGRMMGGIAAGVLGVFLGFLLVFGVSV
jgi:hypothetical protein